MKHGERCGRRPTGSACRPPALERDEPRLDRHPALAFCLSMIPRVKPEGMLFGRPYSTRRVKAQGQAFPDHALDTPVVQLLSCSDARSAIQSAQSDSIESDHFPNC